VSTQEQFISSHAAASPLASGSQPDCPRCNKRMTVKQVSPVLFASEFDDVLYACVTCGTETKRTVRRR